MSIAAPVVLGTLVGLLIGWYAPLIVAVAFVVLVSVWLIGWTVYR